MNSYERVKTALELREPDRVPIVELYVSPNVQSAICPEARDYYDFFDIMGLDAVYSTYFYNFEPAEDGLLRDEWGLIYKEDDTAEFLKVPIKGPISSMEDLKNYRPPDPDAPWRLFTLPDVVKRFKGEKYIVFHCRDVFVYPYQLMGMENFLVACILEPRLVEALLDMVLEVHERLVRNAIRAGADCISLGDDYATKMGPLMSPETFKKYFYPRLAKLVSAIHEEGGKVIKHTDGNIWKLIDMLVDTGADALGPLEPDAGMFLDEVKKKYGDRVAVVGNIDCKHILPSGTEEEVEKAVKELIKKVSPGGGHLISSCNSIHSGVNPLNYLAMINAVKKYGSYPINID